MSNVDIPHTAKKQRRVRSYYELASNDSVAVQVPSHGAESSEKQGYQSDVARTSDKDIGKSLALSTGHSKKSLMHGWIPS